MKTGRQRVFAVSPQKLLIISKGKNSNVKSKTLFCVYFSVQIGKIYYDVESQDMSIQLIKAKIITLFWGLIHIDVCANYSIKDERVKGLT